MGSVDSADDRTFRVNFTSDGATKLRDRVMDKLQEFMGDYTDETLVEYVIVLLRNGRRKDEAINELNVFLGDDTNSFVSWLWDHLDSSLELYVHPQESYLDEVLKAKPTAGDQSGKNDSLHMDSESERVKPNKESKSRHRREWKGLVRDAAEPPPLRSSEIEKIHLEEKTHQRVSRARRSSSPRPVVQRKRTRPDDRENMKREASQVNIDAPRRLLQFAVRDAVGTSRPSNSVTEPTLKRLRSVVSLSTDDSPIVDRPRRIQSVARVPNPMAAVIRAVAEAAEDVTRVKSAGSVFDRLGRGMDVSENSGQLASFQEASVVDDEFAEVDHTHKQTHAAYIQRSDHTGKYLGDMVMLENETGLPFDSTAENDGYDDANLMGHRVTDASQTGTSGGKNGENSLMVPYNVAKNVDDVMWVKRNRDDGQPANTPHKNVNISLNVNTLNTWKPPPYQEQREVAEVDGWRSGQAADGGASKPGMRATKENRNTVTVNGNAKPAADSQKVSQKIVPLLTGSFASGRPLEDADSRTLFVSNVHFAATKDSLSRHFNKFGEVLKVVIITDATTGQLTGSAYVEFMRKEAADNALSLDGTSFMSRILKVVRRSAAHQEAASIMTWPRIARGSPFATARFPRVPFPRGVTGAFRPRPPIRPGARSMQWKRDAQAPTGENGAMLSVNTNTSPTARSLTYIRTEPKPEANTGTS